MRLLPTIFLCFIVMSVSASGLRWTQGVIVLHDRQVLVGDVAIQPAMNVVLFRGNGETTFLPVETIRYTMLNDGIATVPRKFVTRTIARSTSSRVELFEVVVEGPVSVIRKPRGARLPGVDEVRQYDYFVVNELSDVMELSAFRKEIAARLGKADDNKDLRKTLAKEQLDPTRIGDLIRMIGHYNDYTLASAVD